MILTRTILSCPIGPWVTFVIQPTIPLSQRLRATHAALSSKADFGIVGIIGPSWTEITPKAAELASSAHMPMLPPNSEGASLSNKSSYPFFAP